jgi:hypothetical protein
MITTVEARNPQGALLSLPLGSVSNGYAMGEIEGLHPVKAEIVSSPFANLDGDDYQSSRRGPRDLTLNIGLEPDYSGTTVRALRHQLYNWFMTQSWVNLRFTTSDGVQADISGYVEEFDAPLFTDDPNAVIHIRCMNPDFVDADSIVVAGTTVEDMTEFTINYQGTVKAGVRFNFALNRDENNITVYYKPPDNTLRELNFQGALLTGDLLLISTVPGSKGAWVTRAGSQSSVLYGIAPQADWVALQRGINTFRVYATGTPIPFTIEYTNRYGGL